MVAALHSTIQLIVALKIGLFNHGKALWCELVSYDSDSADFTRPNPQEKHERASSHFSKTKETPAEEREIAAIQNLASLLISLL